MEIDEMIEKAEQMILPIFNEIDRSIFENSKKVLRAFHNNNISEIHFNSTTGYGYNDIG